MVHCCWYALQEIPIHLPHALRGYPAEKRRTSKLLILVQLYPWQGRLSTCGKLCANLPRAGLERDLGRNPGYVKQFLYFIVFSGLALIMGLGSANYLIDDGFALILRRGGPWQAWVNAGSSSADPYTRAHIAVTGQLPITSASGLTYFAEHDENGDALSSDCDYEIIARPFNAVWWTIAAYDEDGNLIPNKANRHAFSSQSLTILPDGTQRIALAPRARPGHWLPSGEDKYITLVLRIIRPLAVEGNDDNEQDHHAEFLPQIRRTSC